MKILGRQETDSATIIVETLRLGITPEEFLEKARAMEEKEMANVKLMHGKRDFDLSLSNHTQRWALTS